MLSPVKSFAFNNVDGDHNIVDNSQDHSTNIGPKAGTMTKNIGFGAGATNNGPGAGGINYNHGPGAGGFNSGPGAGSVNASSINGGVQFGYGDPILKQDQYSVLPSLYPDNQMGSILDSMLHPWPFYLVQSQPGF